MNFEAQTLDYELKVMEVFWLVLWLAIRIHSNIYIWACRWRATCMPNMPKNMILAFFGIFGRHVALHLHAQIQMLEWILIAYHNTNQNTSITFNSYSNVWACKFTFPQETWNWAIYIVNSIQNKNYLKKTSGHSRNILQTQKLFFIHCYDH